MKIDLLEVVPISIVIVDSLGKITRINARAGAMFGYQRREMVGQPIELLVPDRFKQHHEKLKSQFMFEHATRRMAAGQNIVGRRRDGTEFPIEVNLATLLSDNGTLVAAAIIDITHQQNRERDLLSKTDALEKLQASDKIVVASMSHELRTPLNAIIGFTGTLLMGMAGSLTDEQKRQLTIIRSAGKQLLDLVNNLLEIGQIEHGHLTVDILAISVSDVIQKVVDEAFPIAAKKDLPIALELAESPIELKTDPRLLYQILANLVGNAITYTDKGQVTVKSWEDDTKAYVSVTDTGIGIREEDKIKLFLAFSRLDPKGVRRGVGLGLRVSQGLAKALGGRIDCESEFGQGSTFTLSLPLTSEEELICKNSASP